jgi:hypothetical protein
MIYLLAGRAEFELEVAVFRRKSVNLPGNSRLLSPKFLTENFGLSIDFSIPNLSRRGSVKFSPVCFQFEKTLPILTLENWGRNGRRQTLWRIFSSDFSREEFAILRGNVPRVRISMLIYSL